ncbi:hypothetical protein [Streptomyces sp. NPDC057403]|uniref:hypothetical protein n=1 Tax=Streptomyces sp. NPDC057403 TaxID=3346119 RepID=UPI00367CB433
MVAAIPQTLADKYGHWTGRVPLDVLSELTVEQLAGRLQRAQTRWDQAMAPDGDGDILAATADAEAILAAPVAGAKPKSETKSALKAVGLTGGDMAKHGEWLSRIPDNVLVKMDRPAVLKRAEIAAAEYQRTGSLVAADQILKADAHVVATAPMTAAAQAAYRRGVREDLAREYGAWIDRIPDAVLAKLDAAEVVERCEEARGLEARGAADPHPGMIWGYQQRATDVLKAMPRAELDAEVTHLEKAALVSDDRGLALGYQERARQLREANPQPQAMARPGWLGKALRAPEPQPTANVLHKADGGRKPRKKAKKAAPPIQKGFTSKAAAARVGAGLDALEQALLLLRANPELNKADSRTRDTIDGLLDFVDEAFNP